MTKHSIRFEIHQEIHTIEFRKMIEIWSGASEDMAKRMLQKCRDLYPDKYFELHQIEHKDTLIEHTGN